MKNKRSLLFQPLTPLKLKSRKHPPHHPSHSPSIPPPFLSSSIGGRGGIPGGSIRGLTATSAIRSRSRRGGRGGSRRGWRGGSWRRVIFLSFFLFLFFLFLSFVSSSSSLSIFQHGGFPFQNQIKPLFIFYETPEEEKWEKINKILHCILVLAPFSPFFSPTSK